MNIYYSPALLQSQEKPEDWQKTSDLLAKKALEPNRERAAENW